MAYLIYSGRPTRDPQFLAMHPSHPRQKSPIVAPAVSYTRDSTLNCLSSPLFRINNPGTISPFPGNIIPRVTSSPVANGYSVNPSTRNVHRHHLLMANRRPMNGTAPSFVHPTMTAPERLSEQATTMNSFHFHVSSSPISIPPLHAASQVRPVTEHVRTAFTNNSVYPDPVRRYCLDSIVESHLDINQLEPDQNSAEAIQILGPVAFCLPSATPPGSILNIFVDPVEKKCLVCGAPKTSMPRALGCVRSHLGLRPFACPGPQMGCLKCVQGKEPARFFTAALLDDHIKGQTRKYACGHIDCEAVLRRGGRKRHWSTVHKGEPFPVGILAIQRHRVALRPAINSNGHE